MDGASDERLIPLASSEGKSKIGKKLAMTSPNNRRAVIDTQLMVSPRTRRPKHSKKLRRRSFDSIDASGLLPRGSNASDDSLNSNDRSDGKTTPSNSNHGFARCDTQRSFTSQRSISRSGRTKQAKFPHQRSFDSIDFSHILPRGSNSDRDESGRKFPLMSPSDSNHSFARCDTQKSFISPRSQTRRTRNAEFPHTRSFDSLEISGSVPQGSNSFDNLKNGETVSGLKCAIPSPNDNFSTTNPQTTRSRQKSKASRHRNFDTNLFAPGLSARGNNGASNPSNDKSTIADKLGMQSPNNSNNITDNRRPGRRARRRSLGAYVIADLPIPSLANRNEDAKDDAKATSSKTSKKRDRGSQSLPSTSGHSGHYSIYTEMTVHTDTYIQANQDDDSSFSHSSAYYSDGGLPYEPNISSYATRVDGDDEHEVDDKDDDDSSNTNFNYLARDNGSLKTLSSVFSLNDFESSGTISTLSVDGEDSDTNGSNHEETPDKRIHFANFPSRQLQQRQQRRMSFGRRPRRYSNGSFGSFGSMNKSGDELTEEEVLTIDGSIPDIPNLPNRVGDLRIKNCYSSGEELVDHADDMEEVTVDDGLTDDEEYFEEVVNDPSENIDDSTKRYEIVLSDDSFVEEIILEVEEEELTLEETYHGEDDVDGDKGAPNIDESSCHGNDESEADCNADECDQEVPQKKIDDNLECNDQTDVPLTVDEKLEVTGDSRNDEGNKDVTPNIEETLELSMKNCQIGGCDKDSVKDPDGQLKVIVDSELHESGNDAPLNTSNNPNGDSRNSSPTKSYRDALLSPKA